MEVIQSINETEIFFCPNCGTNLKPNDLSNENYLVLGTGFQYDSNKEFTLFLQCKCKQILQIEIGEVQKQFKNYSLLFYTKKPIKLDYLMK